MTTLNLDESSGIYQIRAFKPGIIQINEKTFTHSLIITPHQLIEPWAPKTSAELSAEAFTPVLNLKPDILLIGTGEKLIFLAAELYGALINQGIGVEVMNTGAACRTYNALSVEGRQVAAALIL